MNVSMIRMYGVLCHLAVASSLLTISTPKIVGGYVIGVVVSHLFVFMAAVITRKD